MLFWQLLQNQYKCNINIMWLIFYFLEMSWQYSFAYANVCHCIWSISDHVPVWHLQESLWTLKPFSIGPLHSLEKLGTKYRMIQHHCLEKVTPHSHCCKNLKTWSYIQTSYIGIQWVSISVIYRLQERLWISDEGSFVQYCHWVWYPHESS
jgi:hypothetical protein